MTFDREATDGSLDALADEPLFDVIRGDGNLDRRTEAAAVLWTRYEGSTLLAVRGAAARPGGCPQGEDRASFEEEVLSRVREWFVLGLGLASCREFRTWKALLARTVAGRTLDASRELRARRARETRAERFGRLAPPPLSPEQRAMHEQVRQMTREITDAIAAETDPRYIEALYLEAEGWTKVDIAEALGVSATSVHNWLARTRQAVRQGFEQRGVRELADLLPGR